MPVADGGLPGFTPVSNLATPSAPTVLATGDLNHDGKTDLLVGIPGYPGGVAVYLSNASGVLTQMQTLPLSYEVTGALLVDVNGDGYLDVMLPDPDADMLQIWFNDGTGNFVISTSVSFPQNTWPSSVTAADFNGDGAPDLAVLGGRSGVLYVLLNNGRGSLSVTSNLLAASGGTAYSAVPMAAADVTGDGRADVLFANPANGFLEICAGRGDGTLQPPFGVHLSYDLNGMAVGDWDGDGNPDVALATTTHGLEVLHNDGTGNFSLVQTLSGPISGLTTLDLDGDCLPDLLATSGSSLLELKNLGSSFAAPLAIDLPASSTCLATGDFDGDGKLDFAACTQNGVLLGQSQASAGFSSAVQLGLGCTPNELATGDINGDGLPDLMAVCSNSSYAYEFLGLPDAGFLYSPHPLYATGGAATHRPASAVLTDVDGDGRDDAVVAFQGDAGFATLFALSDGGLASPNFWWNGLAPDRIGTGDLNADGHPDLVFTAGYQGLVLFGFGDGGFSPPVAAEPQGYSGGWWPDRFSVGDVNGDGSDDVVFMSSAYGQGRTHFYDGDGGFSAGPDLLLYTDTILDMALGKLDTGAHADLVIAYEPNHTAELTVLSGAGDGTFSTSNPPLSGLGSPARITVADLNGDGIADVVVPGGTSGLVTVFPGMGDGGLGAGAAFFTSSSPTQAVVADFDHDGRSDLAVIGSGATSIEIYTAR
ncbi:MAG: VCBS repeat-containing protein [Deltaproteobacteria bacterium]|nr:VCBS repeat-containing protein [Deltaproteobacteria bacterium]